MYPFGSSFSPDTGPGVGLLGHMVARFLVFKGTSILFSMVAVPIYIPTKSIGGFRSLHTLQNLLFGDSFLMVAIQDGVR